MAEVVTFCRICEAHCGLRVEVEGDRVVSVKPDREHPVSRGYVCVKGTSLGDVNHDPDRLDRPLRRVGDVWEAISWDQALAEIGAKVRRLRRAHGARSVAMYTGNPTFFSAGATLWSGAFLEALGSPNLFASHSIDVNNKFWVSTAMYGLSMVHPVPDLDHCAFFVCLGSNPMVSQMSVVHLPHALGALQGVQARGGRVVIVDPRRTETAARVGEHVPIRPGTDAVLLLGMLHVLVADGLDPSAVAPHVEGLEAFLAAGADWAPARVEAITGVPPATVASLARGLRDADGGVLYMSTGVNMGPFGSLAYWLVQGLCLVTGQLDRRGGLLVPEGAYPALRLAKWLGLGTFDAHRTKVRGWGRVAGAFPLGALAEEIRVDDPERIRALFVCAGNPARSGTGDLAEALDELELLVGIDLYRNDTTARAHYLLPATDMLERPDFALAHTLLQPHPHAQATPAVVPPRAERREEWRIFRDMAKACGAPVWSPTLCGLGARLPVTLERVLDGVLRWGGHTTWRGLVATGAGIALPPTEPGSFLGKRVPRGRVQLSPPELLADLGRLEREVGASVAGLRLIGRRERRRHNTWLPRVPAAEAPVLEVHPVDAEARGIVHGGEVTVRGPRGAVVARARVTDAVMRGVVSLPHGVRAPWDVNRVLPEAMEPVSGQTVFLAHEVELEAGCNGPADAT